MTREEAINEIKSWAIPSEKGREVLETLIPELAESEDERIRKAILGLTYIDGIEPILTRCSITAGDIRTYLEKQKESLPISETCKENANSFADGIIEVRSFQRGMEEGRRLEKQKENPKSADSIPSDRTADAKCEDRWHKVVDSLPDNPREVLCKDEAGNYFIGRYYVGEGWEISNYDDEDKPHHLNPPVSKWIDFPSDLDEAAEEYLKYHKLETASIRKLSMYRSLAFKAGAEWQKEQMMKEAVDGYVNYYEDSGGILMAEAQVGCPYHNGDKVRIVVLKAEEEKK